ncbi:MAG: (Fe-S)-binding protein [Deltaproteobacteria bacterium]|nr:MAG: (Fe-S)-binding protein [Deltaproteobacteria bacterium]
MKYEDVVHRCFRCGYCKFTSDYAEFNCPSYRKFGLDTYAPGGRMWLINAWINNEIKTSPHYAEILYSCVTCGNCQEHCVFDFRDDLLNIFETAKQELVSEGFIPSAVRDFFKAININGNPYKEPQNERGKWAEGTGIQPFSDQEYLFYVGDVGSYDERGKKMSRIVGSLLAELGLSIGILGSEETCDGNDVKAMGEVWLFQQLAEANIQKFKEIGVKNIITLDPHAFNAFNKEYPKLGGDFNVWHYTQILASLLKEKKPNFAKYDVRLTYHDPCYLGRHSGVYEAPREILKAIPGVEFVEMDRNKENSFCCGGGGGNFFTDILGIGEDSPARIRVREALDTGSEIIAVACPMCAKMLDDAVKSEELDETIKVMDVAEVIKQTM